MSEMKMTSEAEVEDFSDELSDEALDRAKGAACVSTAAYCCSMGPPVADR